MFRLYTLTLNTQGSLSCPILISFCFLFLYRRSSAIMRWSSTHVLCWIIGAPSVQGPHSPSTQGIKGVFQWTSLIKLSVFTFYYLSRSNLLLCLTYCVSIILDCNLLIFVLNGLDKKLFSNPTILGQWCHLVIGFVRMTSEINVNRML